MLSGAERVTRPGLQSFVGGGTWSLLQRITNAPHCMLVDGVWLEKRLLPGQPPKEGRCQQRADYERRERIQKNLPRGRSAGRSPHKDCLKVIVIANERFAEWISEKKPCDRNRGCLQECHDVNPYRMFHPA